MKTKITINRKNFRNYGLVLLAGLLLGWLFFHRSGEEQSENHEHSQESTEVSLWTCSMHPQIRQEEPGLCPICGMELIPLESGSKEAMDPDAIQMSESAIKLADIRTMTVKKDYSNKEVDLLGKVKPDERNIAELTARFGGRIEKLFVNFTGQHVRKGEKLATIYSPGLITAQKELLEAMEYKDSNPAFYRATRNKLKLWDLTDAQIDAIEAGGEPQNYFDILSPITGTVTMRHVAVGDYVKEGNALFQVINLERVWVMFEAYESDLPWLSQGDPVEFTIQSLPGEKFKGKVTYIDPFLDPKTRVANVRVELANPDLELKPEMFANGTIKPRLSGNQKDLLIPKSAVLWTGKRSVVYVLVPGHEEPTFRYHEITLGPEAGDFYVVENGLSEGEVIAVNGVFKIDAAAQLAGKPSMMNPEGGVSAGGHQHGGMNMNMDMEGGSEHSGHSDMDMKENTGDGSVSMNHQSTSDKAPTEEQVQFVVYGNCDMCKDRIERATNNMEGVNNAVWNKETKMISVSFNGNKTSLPAIHKAIAAVGHDTDQETAPDEVYESLPPCCQYARNSASLQEPNREKVN